MKSIITIGDCNGIGLEVLFKALFHFHSNVLSSNQYFTLCGNTETIIEYAQKMGYNVEIHDANVILNNTLELHILEIGNYSPIKFGTMTESAAELAVNSLETAIQRTISRDYDAIITLPISKVALNRIGWKFPGQTEMLADYCNVPNPMMILAGDSLRVALATIHLPILKVPFAISQLIISERIEKISISLQKDFAVTTPKIAVLGLNPHAGEEGSIGLEEIDSINPAIKECRTKGIDVYGAFPADGFFAHGDYKNYDAILAMYHDQGLIPLKLLVRGGGVNITVGLPIVRTSPDHGTAYAIAGKGIADANSTIEAIRTAIIIANNRIIS